MASSTQSLVGWIVALLLLMMLVGKGETVCCPSKTIAFRLLDDSDHCSAYEADTHDNGVCKVEVCLDGTHVKGSYCGRGPCNIFGCSCEGGCRAGDTLKKFAEFYGLMHIRDVRFA
ncbi:hypothetical protein KR093_006377 [Drosophila rubida]|uniref:Protein Diedel n=1 Tax=Drosophila rubida TaxID=30044 RepID=A0AAD4PI39_9MUSC|nr:hypothetical protein KR093_006377 [Drosophila rubida]